MSVLRSVLSTLVGRPGGIVNDDFQVDPLVTEIPTSVLDQIKEFCRFGKMYRGLECFVEGSTFYSGEHRSDESLESRDGREGLDGLNSLYLPALCVGVDEFLESYRRQLVQVEEEFAHDALLSFPRLNHLLSSHFILLHSISNIVNAVRSQRMTGGKLLSFLQKRSLSGNPLEEKAMKRLLFHIRSVFFKQMVGWMVYGILTDPHKEFFIRDANDSKEDGNEQDGEDAEAQVEQKLKKKDILHTQSRDSGEWASRFEINLELLPSFVRLPVSEKILFVGKAIRVLRTSREVRDGASLRDDELMFLERFHQLRTAVDFDILEFERAVDEIRGIIASHLWTLVVVNSDFIRHLQALKDYFLLAKGNFYQCFLDEAGSVFALPPSISANIEIRSAFEQAGSKSGVEESDEYYDLLSMEFVPKKTDDDIISFSSWDGLRIGYKVKWPLHIIFTPEVFEQYNELFSFLLNIRRVQVELQRCWGDLMQLRLLSVEERKRAEPLLQMRTMMSFIVDNIQFYLQADVLDVQFRKLVHRVRESKDFESVQRAHIDYLSIIKTQCCLNSTTIFRVINDVMKKCMQFCHFVRNIDRSSIGAQGFAEMGEEPIKEFREMESAFRRSANFLFTMLSGVRDPLSPHLAQLLMRIDYNGFFSQRSHARKPTTL